MDSTPSGESPITAGALPQYNFGPASDMAASATDPPTLQARFADPSPAAPDTEGVGMDAARNYFQTEVEDRPEQYRPVAPPTTAEDEQAARIRAYDALIGADTKSTADFLDETSRALLPDSVTNWFSETADTVAAKSSSAIPEGVKNAADAFGQGVERVGSAIDALPGLLVSAIPEQVLSKEVKQLIFTDFSNTLRGFFHTNILSMPFVFRQAGLIGGIVLLVGVAITSEYATEAYFSCKNQMKRANTVVLYGDVPRMVWGKWYPMINLFYGATRLIGFIAFSSSNAKVLLAAMGLTGGGATAVGLIVPSVLALPMVFMKNAKNQQPLSMVSNTCVIVSVILMMVDFPYTVQQPLKLWASNATEFFVALGICVFAFMGIGSAIPIERTMPPKRYRRMLRAAVTVSWALLMTFGLSGFLSYGTGACSVMTVALQEGPLRTAASALLFVASVFIIPQQTFPLCELSDRRLLGIRRITTYWEWKPNLLRFSYLVLSAVAAFLLPYYGLVLSISGSLGCGIIGLVVPAGLDYVRRLRWGLRRGRTLRWWEYIIVFSLGTYGCIVVVIGVVSGSYQLWLNVQTNSKDTC